MSDPTSPIDAKLDALQHLLDGQHLPMRHDAAPHLCDATGAVQGYSTWPEFRDLVFGAVDNLPALLEIARAARDLEARAARGTIDLAMECHRVRMALRNLQAAPR